MKNDDQITTLKIFAAFCHISMRIFASLHVDLFPLLLTAGEHGFCPFNWILSCCSFEVGPCDICFRLYNNVLFYMETLSWLFWQTNYDLQQGLFTMSNMGHKLIYLITTVIEATTINWFIFLDAAEVTGVMNLVILAWNLTWKHTAITNFPF